MHHCATCGKKFSFRESYLQHKAAKHPIKQYPCDLCSKRFASSEGLRDHTRAKHGGCRSHENDEYDPDMAIRERVIGNVIEELRRQYPFLIRRPHALGSRDSHNHLWYCFGCETKRKDHRSFNSHLEMLQHILYSHDHWLEEEPEIDEELESINIDFSNLTL